MPSILPAFANSRDLIVVDEVWRCPAFFPCHALQLSAAKALPLLAACVNSLRAVTLHQGIPHATCITNMSVRRCSFSIVRAMYRKL